MKQTFLLQIIFLGLSLVYSSQVKASTNSKECKAIEEKTGIVLQNHSQACLLIPENCQQFKQESCRQLKRGDRIAKKQEKWIRKAEELLVFDLEFRESFLFPKWISLTHKSVSSSNKVNAKKPLSKRVQERFSNLFEIRQTQTGSGSHRGNEKSRPTSRSKLTIPACQKDIEDVPKSVIDGNFENFELTPKFLSHCLKKFPFLNTTFPPSLSSFANNRILASSLYLEEAPPYVSLPPGGKWIFSNKTSCLLFSPSQALSFSSKKLEKTSYFLYPIEGGELYYQFIKPSLSCSQNLKKWEKELEEDWKEKKYTNEEYQLILFETFFQNHFYSKALKALKASKVSKKISLKEH